MYRKILFFLKHHDQTIIVVLSAIISTIAIIYSFYNGSILAYGDAESHINIAKRVISSLTPGLAQLGGIWLPLPHILMIPFIASDALWRTGLGGSIVSGIAFIISSLFLYKIILLLVKNNFAASIGWLFFVTNPNILYMQSTPMSELPLLVFFMLSSYYFFSFLQDDTNIIYLIVAGFFGFCASLSRYDGWFLVGIEFIAIILFYITKLPFRRNPLEGKAILYGTIAFFGIVLWLLWDFLILGDPLYFSNSPFSAKSQQTGWLAKGELPSYHNILNAITYYTVASIENIGLLLSCCIGIGLILFIFSQIKNKFLILLIFFVPFIFYVTTLYIGQSIIFIPGLTPANFEWKLFNVRYGLMMIPCGVFLFAYLISKSQLIIKFLLLVILIIQFSLYPLQKAQIITYLDGTQGLSASKAPDAQRWLRTHYDRGLVLLDDYSRTVSIAKSNLPIQDVIYVGNKPYWQESLSQPEKYARWIVIQQNDSLWKNIYENPTTRGRLFKYFQKEYTSPNILIFKRNTVVAKS